MSLNMEKDVTEPLTEINKSEETKCEDTSILGPDAWTFEKVASKYYILIAFTGAMLQGSYNFLFSELVMYWDTGSTGSTVYLSFPRFLGQFLFGAVFHLFKAYKLKKNRGFYWSKSTSNYLIQENINNPEENNIQEVQNSQATRYKYDWKAIGGMSTRGLLVWTNQIGSYYTIILCMLAEVNYSLMVCITLLQTFVVAIVFHFWFGEKLQIYHYIGMTLILIAMIMLSISDLESEGTEADTLTILAPLALSILVLFLNAGTSITARFTTTRTKLKSFQFYVDSQILGGVGFFVVYFFFERPSAALFMACAAIGTMHVIAALFLTTAVIYGKGAISVSIYQCSILLQLMLEVIFAAKVPNVVQWIAFFIAIFGGSFIIFTEKKKK